MGKELVLNGVWRQKGGKNRPKPWKNKALWPEHGANWRSAIAWGQSQRPFLLETADSAKNSKIGSIKSSVAYGFVISRSGIWLLARITGRSSSKNNFVTVKTLSEGERLSSLICCALASDSDDSKMSVDGS